MGPDGVLKHDVTGYYEVVCCGETIFFFLNQFSTWAQWHTFTSSTGEAEASNIFELQLGQHMEFQNNQTYIDPVLEREKKK